ncbi:MAG: rod shape-determining protein RodA [Treponemataceae bacterium]|nr:rod shape-determining protein RodA [Treponemataceae bacterium]
MKPRIFEVFDYVLFFPVVLLIIIGVFFIYSAGVDSNGISQSTEFVKQIIFAGSGLILMIVTALIDYRKLKEHAWKFYVALVGLLLFTIFYGKAANNATSWLGIGGFGIQPSEFCKIAFILFLGSFLDKTALMEEKTRFAITLLILVVPFGLILIQPDMGTASVFIPIYMAMCFAAGIPARFIMAFFSFGVLSVLFTIFPTLESTIIQKSLAITNIFTNLKFRFIVVGVTAFIALIGVIGFSIYKTRYYYWISYVAIILALALVASIPMGKVLKEYQVNRLIVFLNPDLDPQNLGWNLNSSKRAIGSGNLLGQGFLKGSQSHGKYLYGANTDFIFSIISEEIGFVGSFVVIMLFFVLFIRILYILKKTTDIYGYYVGSGILFMIFYHFMINVGMAMGLMPITGIPLFFLSYGGSSLWTVMICIGIIMSINCRRLDFDAV